MNYKNSNLMDVVINKFLIKRLNREEKEFNLNIHNFFYYIQEDKIAIDIYKNKKKKFKFIINNSYPFRAPKLLIYDKNNKQVSYLSLFNSISKFPIIKEHLIKQNIQCICCNSVLCSGKWSPAIKLNKILEEYYNNHNLILTIFNKYWFLKYSQINNIPNEIICYIISFID